VQRWVALAAGTLALLVVLGLYDAFAAPKAEDETKPAQAVEVTLLRMASGSRYWEPDSTLWRYYETWQTDLVRLDSGKLVRVDPLNPRVGFSPGKIWSEQQAGRNPKELEFPVQEAAKVVGSAFPPADWMKVEFDDDRWVRTATPMGSHYRSLALVSLRGKFEVKDPTQVTELTLQASIQGGAVFYLNGQEIGRAFLPAGKVDFETPATDYPKDAFVTPLGSLLPQINSSEWIMGEDEYAKAVQDGELQRRYKSRFRPFSAKVPTSMLRKGLNVLAVEAHRSPACEVMFTKVNPKEMGYNLPDHRRLWWNRASIERLKLTAKAVAASVVGNTSRPKGIQAWNWPTWERVDPRFYGDPNEPVRPIRIAGAKSGVFAGQVVLSSPAPFRGVEAAVTELKGPLQSVLPKSSVRVRYPQYYPKHWGAGFDPLEDSPPPEIEKLSKSARVDVATQPVWLTIQVPRDARSGDYSGTMTVRAEDFEPTTFPIELHVSDYVLPDPKDFITHMGFVQSPDTLALRYDVPMWSEAHWKLIDRSFQLLGQLATKELTIPLVRRSHFGNEHAMVWWVRGQDGSYRPDLRIVEKYIDLAARHLGKIPVVIFYVSEGEEGRTIPWITEFDPATGELKDARGPRWGTEEAVAFWKPAFDGFRRILAKHGLEQSLALGYHADGGNGPECAKECIQDLKVLAPEGRWVRLGHIWFGNQRLDRGPNGNPYARVGLVGNYGVFWDPDKDKPFYGWQNPYVVTAYTRGTFHPGSALRDYRLCAEAALLTGQRESRAGWGVNDFAGQFGRDTFLGIRGFAPWGADFWPVLSGRGGWHDIIGRYNDPAAAHWDPRSSWSTVMLNNFQVTYIISDGADGPIASVRSEMLREGLQEAEARVFVQNALLNEDLRTKLGPALAGRAKELCDQRTRDLRYLSEYSIADLGKEPWKAHYIFSPSEWQERSLRLYEMAAEVAKALARP